MMWYLPIVMTPAIPRPQIALAVTSAAQEKAFALRTRPIKKIPDATRYGTFRPT